MGNTNTAHGMDNTVAMIEAEHDTVDREAETAVSLDEVSTVPRDEQTEARPHLLTLHYATNTPQSLTDKFPKQRLRKHGNQAFEMGRGQGVDVLLNDTHMPRSFLEISCMVHPEDGPKWYVKNKSNKKPVRIVRNGVRATLKHEEKQELVDNCELKLESLNFVLRTEDGDIGEFKEFELEILPMESDSTNSTSSLRSLNRQTSSSDDSAYSLTSASALNRNRAGSGPSASQITHQNGVVSAPLPGNCFGLPLAGHRGLPGSTPVSQLAQPGSNPETQTSAYGPSQTHLQAGSCQHRFHNPQHPGSQYSQAQVAHIMNPSSASSQASHLTNSQANMMMVNPTATPGYAVLGSGPPGHMGYPMAGGHPQVMNQYPHNQCLSAGFSQFPNQQSPVQIPLQNNGHPQIPQSSYQGQAVGFSQVPNQQYPHSHNGEYPQVMIQHPSNQAQQAGFSQFHNQQYPAQNQFLGAPNFNPQAPVSQHPQEIPSQPPPGSGHLAVHPQGQNHLNPFQPSLRPGIAESQQSSTAAVNIIMTSAPYAMPELQGTSLQPNTSMLNYPNLSQHPSEQSQHLLSQQTVIQGYTGQHQGQRNPPQPLHGPLSMPVSSLDSEAHLQLPSSYGRSQAQHHPSVHAVQPESAMHIQQQQSPAILSTPTSHDRNPQLYYAPNGGLPVAPPTTQLENLKLGYPVQVTTAIPTEVTSVTPANSLAHSGGASIVNSEGSGRASDVPFVNLSDQQASESGSTPGTLHSGATGVAPSAVAISSLTNPASNGNSVNLRVHEAVAETPASSLGSLGVHDLGPSLQHGPQGHGNVGQGQGHGQGQRDQGHTQNRQPQENDDREPQEHDDQEN